MLGTLLDKDYDHTLLEVMGEPHLEYTRSCKRITRC